MNILPRIKSYQELDGQWKIGKALKVKGDMSFLKLGINLLKNHYSAFDIAVEEGGEDSSIFAERITERGGEANEYYEIEITERRSSCAIRICFPFAMRRRRLSPSRKA